MAAHRGDGKFLDLLKNDAEIAKSLAPKEIDALFDLSHHLRHVDRIFEHVFA
jgi:adenylosuccinate lyase